MMAWVIVIAVIATILHFQNSRQDPSTYLIVASFLYILIFKAFLPRSIGNWVTGTKLVGLDGRRPSVLREFARVAVALLGNVFLIFDVLHIFWSDDPTWEQASQMQVFNRLECIRPVRVDSEKPSKQTEV
jgi:hypothetical protein